VAALLLFGGGKFFQEKVTYVMFFDSSVDGLNVGAPVIFRGVQVGQVTEIEALANPQTYDIVIKVMVELVRGSIKVGAEGKRFANPTQAMQELIRKGARASLRMQSFVTGLLYVSFDFYPDTPIKLLGLDPTYPELPTTPSDLEQVKATLQGALGELKKLPLDAIVAEVMTMLKRINSLLEAPEIRGALVALRDAMTGAQHLVAHTDAQVESLGPKLAGTVEVAAKALEALRVTMLDAQKLVRNVDGQVTPLASGAKETLTSAKDALAAARIALGQAQKSLVTLTEAATPVLKEADRTLAGTTALTSSDSAVLIDLSRTLRSLDEAARSIRTLAGTLERNPEMLIRGRSR
jgi:paraquat-inducible protein B